MSNRVFLAEPNRRYNTDNAQKFGTVSTLAERTLNPFDIVGTTDTFYKALRRLKYDPTQDLICLTGHTLVVSFLLAVAYEYACDQFGTQAIRVLMFDAVTSKYTERSFSVATPKVV